MVYDYMTMVMFNLNLTSMALIMAKFNQNKIGLVNLC